jgi:hypothetical protein
VRADQVPSALACTQAGAGLAGTGGGLMAQLAMASKGSRVSGQRPLAR